MPSINDRLLVFLAFLTVLILIAILVLVKGCSGAEPIMLVLGGSITTLVGVLGGISRGANPADTATTTTVSGNPPQTKTETKPA